MNADGSGVERLTENATEEAYPIFSPDGSQIAYLANPDDYWALFVMNADGTHPVQVTGGDEVSVGLIGWSPNGKQITFASNVADGETEEIYVINVDGSNQRQVTDNAFEDSGPAWSLR